MSKQKVRRPQAKRRPQARKGRTAAAARKGARRTDRTSWIAAAVIIAIGAALVFAFAGTTKTKSNDVVAPAGLVKKVTTIPATVFSQVGIGTSTPLPKKLTGEPLLAKSGTPRVIYLGAEYCPYCATERWAMVAAFSRFGKFTNLKTSSSTNLDVFPNTPTFSFHGSKYTSKYVIFEPVETQTNIQQNGGYKPLDNPTSEQAKLEAKYDYPPYVAESSKGAIPFIDFANQYLISGASYSPQVLQGKSLGSIADAMQDPSSDIAKGAVGTANAMTATICTLTKNQPSNVCSGPAIKTIQNAIG